MKKLRNFYHIVTNAMLLKCHRLSIYKQGKFRLFSRSVEESLAIFFNSLILLSNFNSLLIVKTFIKRNLLQSELEKTLLFADLLSVTFQRLPVLIAISNLRIHI
jgi:hypothetical protein